LGKAVTCFDGVNDRKGSRLTREIGHILDERTPTRPNTPLQPTSGSLEFGKTCKTPAAPLAAERQSVRWLAGF